MRTGERLLVAVVFASLASPSSAAAVEDGDVFTLFRDSLIDGIGKVHIATFDTVEGRDYRDNCWRVRDLMQAQPGVLTHFWCEQGRVKEADP